MDLNHASRSQSARLYCEYSAWENPALALILTACSSQERFSFVKRTNGSLPIRPCLSVLPLTQYFSHTTWVRTNCVTHEKPGTIFTTASLISIWSLAEGLLQHISYQSIQLLLLISVETTKTCSTLEAAVSVLVCSGDAENGTVAKRRYLICYFYRRSAKGPLNMVHMHVNSV